MKPILTLTDSGENVTMTMRKKNWAIQNFRVTLLECNPSPSSSCNVVFGTCTILHVV